MSTLLEMASGIVSAHASSSAMTTEELLSELTEVHATLSAMERGETIAAEPAAEEEQAPAVTKRKAFGKKQVFCMICGQGFKTLSRHLKAAHGMSPNEYREKYDIPRSQSLASKDYSEERRQMAIEKDLASGLAKARAAKVKKK